MLPPPLRPLSTLTALVLFLLDPAAAITSLSSARKAQDRTLIEVDVNAGAGRPVAHVDWNSDRFLDLVSYDTATQRILVRLWNPERDQYDDDGPTSAPLSAAPSRIFVGDWRLSGQLDILLFTGSVPEYRVSLFEHNRLDVERPLGTVAGEPFVLDWFGNHTWSFLAADRVHSLVNGQLVAAPASESLAGGTLCALADGGVNGFVDLNGDCLADLFVSCAGSRWQIWLREAGGSGFSFHSEGPFPQNTVLEQTVLADIDGDGTVDVVLMLCDWRQQCTLQINYNRQMPLCASDFRTATNCRTSQSLCRGDPAFALGLGEPEPGARGSRVTVDLAGLLRETGDKVQLQKGGVPVPLREGDLNADGYPDLLLPLARGAALLANVPCTSELCGAEAAAAKRRTFQLDRSPHLDALRSTALESASFADWGEEGKTGLLLYNTDGSQQALYNNLKSDSFFLKLTATDGACMKNCGGGGAPAVKPYGASGLGAVFKFVLSIADSQLSYERRLITLHQLSRLGANVVPTTNILMSIGRTNNYIDTLFLGMGASVTSWNGIIPNSKLVAVTQGPSSEWWLELYVEPAKYMLWVGMTIIVSLMCLGIVIASLHYAEQKEDAREKRQGRHALNFDAL